MSALEVQTLEQAKEELTKRAYGESKVKQVAEIRQALAKSAFEARKQQLASQKDIFEKRKDLIKGIDKFWLKSFQRSAISNILEEDDYDALSYLEDLTLNYSAEDPREFTAVFTFAEASPYFKETSLKKGFTVKADAKKSDPYDLMAPIEGDNVVITWSSDDKNLIKKYPRPDVSSMEEYDDVQTFGSFFNFFTETTDPNDIIAMLQDVYEQALDIFAGFAELEDEEQDSEDEDEDEEDGDDNEEVDLGDSETDMPKKKKQKQG